MGEGVQLSARGAGAVRRLNKKKKCLIDLDIRLKDLPIIVKTDKIGTKFIAFLKVYMASFTCHPLRKK